MGQIEMDHASCGSAEDRQPEETPFSGILTPVGPMGLKGHEGPPVNVGCAVDYCLTCGAGWEASGAGGGGSNRVHTDFLPHPTKSVGKPYIPNVIVNDFQAIDH